MSLTDSEKIRMQKILLEDEVKFFDEEDYQFYVDENNGDIDAAIYQILILKSEDTTLSVSGLTTTSTSSYFKMLAARYRPINSGTLK